MSKELPRRPSDAHHSFIVGQNGGGKTAAAAYQFAWRSYDKMPWIVVNYKRDEYLDEIPGAREMNVNAPIPKEPGIYITRPDPFPGSIEKLLFNAIEHERVGLYIDEGLNVGEHSKGLRLVLTQGRSKRVPLIFLSQRPCRLGVFPLSEAKFFQAFYLQAQNDRKTICEYVPVSVNAFDTLPEYHSFYYDSEKRRLAKIGPVPFGDEVLDIFDRRKPRRFRGVK
jgi:hypothetical protein